MGLLRKAKEEAEKRAGDTEKERGRLERELEGKDS